MAQLREPVAYAFEFRGRAFEVRGYAGYAGTRGVWAGVDVCGYDESVAREAVVRGNVERSFQGASMEVRILFPKLN